MILCIGEILADLIGEKENDIMKYSRFPGGAPLNVAAGIKRLGGAVGFIGSVGDDIIGNYLINFCNTINFDYLDINLDKEHNTTLAFVDNDEFGERSFAFNRFNTADYFIDESRLECIKDIDIVHIGSLMLREDKGFELALKIIEIARKYNKVVSFDVNYRDDIYDSKELALYRYNEIVKRADIVKFSLEEVEYFTNCNNFIEGINKLVRPEQMVFISLGSKGSYYQYNGESGIVPTHLVKAVDTTGAGDAFYACILTYLDNMEEYNRDYILNAMKHANICGGLACSKKGAISALPTKLELEERFKCLYLSE